MIGNHKSSCSCCACCFKQADFKLYNVGGATTARVVSMTDNNAVWINDESGYQGNLNRDEVLEISLAEGDVLYSCDYAFSGGELGSSDRVLMPDYLANDVLGFTASRYGGVQIKLYSLGATSADIYRNGVLVQTIALTPDNVSTFTQTGNYTGNWKVVANGQVLGFKSEDSPFNGDSDIILKPSTDIIGWASTAAYIAKENAQAIGTAFQVYSHLGDYLTGTIATTYNIVNSIDLPHSTAQDNRYDPLVNIRVQSTDGLYGNSRGDGDGGNDTALMPIDLLRTHHKIPQPVEYVSISSEGTTTVDVFDETGTFVITLNTTRVNTNPLAPHAVRYGLPNGATNFPAGYEFVGSEPIMVVYQPKGAGGFGSDDDETISLGYNL